MSGGAVSSDRVQQARDNIASRRQSGLEPRPEDLRVALDFLAGLGVDLIITSGGLGPTHDDLTMAAVAYVGMFLPFVILGRWVETRFAWKR